MHASEMLPHHGHSHSFDGDVFRALVTCSGGGSMSAEPTTPVRIPRGQDRFNEQHDVGIGILSFKVTEQESQGALLIAELAHHTPGGPPRHVHPNQDEWFVVVEGHYQIAVGDRLFDLEPGDSVFGPRQVPHTWAYVGGEAGRMVF